MKEKSLSKVLVVLGVFIAVFFAVNINAQENKDYTKLVAQLEEALKNNDSQAMSQIVSKLDLTSKEEKRFAEETLFLASQNGEIEIAEILLDKGVDVNSKTEYNNQLTPLHAAVFKNNAKMVNFLISKGADVNAYYKYSEDYSEQIYRPYTAEEGLSPLHIAAIFNSDKASKILLKKGADVNIKNNFGQTPLFKVKTKTMAKLLLSKGADINVKDHFGGTPLHEVVNNPEIAKLLIEKGADVNAKTESTNMTPLFYVKNKEIAEMLIEKGADVNALSKDEALGPNEENAVYPYVEQTPLYHAIQNGNYDVAEILVAKGADMNAGSVFKPLHLAAFEGNFEIAKLLIEKGSSDVDVKGICERTPLFYAKTVPMVRLLLSEGADVNARDCMEKTPLHLAIQFNNADVVRELIYEGADVNAKDDDGKTPLDTRPTFAEAKYEDIKWFLNYSGAKSGKDLAKDILVDKEGSMKIYREGVKFYKQGDYKKAKEKFQEAIKLDPNNVDAMLGLKKIEEQKK